MNKKLLFAAALTAFASLTGVVPVEAAPPGSGWDENPDIVVGGGSDTTYLAMQRLEVLYNGTPGCTIDTGTTSVNKGKCIAGQTTPTNGNFDHDVLVSATPTGSSAGVNALLPSGVQYNPAIDYARSSRGPSGVEAQSVTFWGYARDAIAVLTFGSRQGVALSRQDIIDIYTCVKTDWSQFGLPAGPIIPWDMNAASGTTASFKSYIAPAVFGTCVRKLTSGTAPFENDVKPILADAGPDLVLGTADDDENNYVWWISYGNWSTYPYTANGFVNGNTAGTPISSNLVTVEGTVPSASSISGNTYAILRTLYHVTKETDADCNTVPGTDGVCNNAGTPTVYGSSTGKGGAVRHFTEWLCRTSNTQQLVNSVTGRGYRSEIVTALNLEGFQQVPAAGGLRTAGYACAVSN